MKLQDKAISFLLTKMVTEYHPEIEYYDVIFDDRNGLCEINVYVDGTEYEQEVEIEHDIITALSGHFGMKPEKIIIKHISL